MTSTENKVDNTENEGEKTPEKHTFFQNLILLIEKRSPRLAELLKDIRVQALLLFLILLVIYLNLIIWDFYFSSDSVPYGLTLKLWFEEGSVDSYELLRPAHPLTMPLAIAFTYPMLPIIGSNYLLSYAILNAVMGAATVALFYLVCYVFIKNRPVALICSLGLAFSFAFWENCEMAEDKSLGFFLFVFYIAILFSFVGEISPFKRFERLKSWQKGLVTGIFMGLLLAAHVSFVLVFLFTLIVCMRYFKLKFLKSTDFFMFVIGAALVCGIVFGIVAIALGVGSIGEFVGMFTSYHTGEGGKEYFALADPGNFSLATQLRGLAGGVFTTFFMFISEGSTYKGAIIGLGAVVIFLLAYTVLYARKNKVVSSFYILMAIWFANYFFFAPDDRNAWVYLLVPIWLSCGIGLDIMQKEGLTLILFKRKLSDRITKFTLPIMCTLVAILLVNNGIVFAEVHFSHDEREKFVNFVEDNINEEDMILLVDESTMGFFDYYSDIKTVNYIDVIYNQNVSDYINTSFENQTSVYLAEYWLLESYVKVGSPRASKSYDDRLRIHKENLDRFHSMYNITLAYDYQWTDIYRITDLR